MKYTCFVPAILFLWVNLAQAQKIRPLSVGDTVPDITLNHIINAPYASCKLSDFKGKVVILDFWATWCGACIKNFDKLDVLQRKYSDQLQVLLINTKSTGDDDNKIKNLLGNLKNAAGLQLNLATVTRDTVINQLFPHTLIPHYVWLKNKRVIAITNGDEVTAINIERLLKDNHAELVTKKDIPDFDAAKPLLNNLDKIESRVAYYNSFFSGYINGLSSKQGNTRNITQQRWYAINRPVIKLYQFATGYYDNRLFIQSIKIDTADLLEDKSKESWKSKHLYCYEITLPGTVTDSIRKLLMINDLNRFLNLDAHFETKMVRCWVLKGEIKEMKAVDSSFQCTATQLVHLFNSNYKEHPSSENPIIIDETLDSRGAKLSIPNNSWLSLSSLQEAIKKNYLTLQLLERPVSFFVISDPAKQAIIIQ
ncbi:MAG: TlpA family protein disulfide reductase [Chitinophagaceae bacterium]|nr:TlpA family protein disulfide reductase [Chitinophagaceae bacterium]